MTCDFRAVLTRHAAVVDDNALDPRAFVTQHQWRSCAADLHARGCRFFDITAIDRGQAVEVILYLCDSPGTHFSVRVLVRNDHMHLDSLSGVFPPAGWGEREVYDLFGVIFDGHPDMTRILQPDDATTFPLRRSFELEEHAW